MKYIVKYDYIGEEYPDYCYGIEDECESAEEAIERCNELKQFDCYCSIEIINCNSFL